jgi:tetratricopeptide (TPR) repeat protein
MHILKQNSMTKPQVASRGRLAYYRAQPFLVAVALVMKLQRYNEHRKSDPPIPEDAISRAPSDQHFAKSRIGDSRRKRTHRSYVLTALSLVALLFTLPAGARPASTAQAPGVGRTELNNAAFSNVEKLRLTLALARSYRLTDQPQRALDTLAPLRAGPWPSAPLEAEYHDEIARDQEALGRPSEARGELERAVALDPTADRRFRLSQLAERVGDREEARRQLEAAVAAEPGNMEYKAALAYALRNSGDLAGAAELLSSVLAAEPNRYALHEDLGYTYLGLGENDKAIEQFKWTIDNQQLYPTETKEERETTARTIEGLRRTINAVEPHWTAYGYTNLCLTGHYCERRIRNLESLVSSNQGGLELDYQPPNIGFIDGRIFQAFARTFWSYTPGTISPQGNSFQGGIGIHYKPLRDYNLVLSGERLIKFGANAVNNWEGRISFSTSTGYEIDPVASQSWYSLLYLDFAGTPQSPHQILTYADGRGGVNFNFADRAAISPFVYGIFRGNYGVGANTSAEAGIGASVRGFFYEDKYHAARDALELLPRLGYTVYDSLATPSVVFSITLVARF